MSDLEPAKCAHVFAYFMLPNVWRCACGETIVDERMPQPEPERR